MEPHFYYVSMSVTYIGFYLSPGLQTVQNMHVTLSSTSTLAIHNCQTDSTAELGQLF